MERSGRLARLSRKTLVSIYKTTRNLSLLQSERSVLLLRGKVSREKSGAAQCQKGLCRGNYSAASMAKDNSSDGVCGHQVNVTVSWPNFIRENHYLPPSKPLGSLYIPAILRKLNPCMTFPFQRQTPFSKRGGILSIRAEHKTEHQVESQEPLLQHPTLSMICWKTEG